MTTNKAYLERAKIFIQAVLKIQEEVGAGAEFDKYQKEYEEKLKLTIPQTYKTIEQLYTHANNGHKEMFAPILLDLTIAYEGFKKWPFSEAIEKTKTIDKEVEETSALSNFLENILK
jgi:hypothetical protein